MNLRIESLCGDAIAAHVDALAETRIRVFRDWPYLYEGTAAYERHYLETYLRCPRSLTVLVWDGAHCVGASTALPLADASAETQQPFIDAGYAVPSIDYFGESILLPEYRGQGIGVKFFEIREAHARAHGLSTCAFCAVDRPANHPARPQAYLGNDQFWHHRGYQRAPNLLAHFSWPDIGETVSTAKPMVFWLRTLPEPPAPPSHGSSAEPPR